MKKIILILTLMYLNSFSQTNESINEDGTKFEAPRLAGDSLAIKPKDKSSNSTADSIKDMFQNGKVKGLIRYGGQYRDKNLHTGQDANSPVASSSHSEKVQQYSAIGGYLGYETASFNNISLGATFYTAQKAGNNPDNRTGLGGLNEDDGADSYAVLGEAYIKFKTKEHDFRFGRREMPNYRFVSLSNIRFSPFTHEGTTYENKMFEDIGLTLGYITKQKDRNSEDFQGMVRSARVNKEKVADLSDIDVNDFDAVSGSYDGDSKEMAMLGLSLKKDKFSIEAWDYYVDDFINTLYMYGDYSFKIDKDTTLTLAGQYANQQDVGDSVAGEVDTWFYGIKAQLSYDYGITLFTAFNEVSYNENSYDGGTIFVRWGTPQMFNSYQVQDSELAGTKSLGVGAQFELGKMGLIDNTVVRFRYAQYDMPDSLNDRFARLSRSEATFDIRYSFTKNDGFGIFTEMDGLSIQFRVAYDNYDNVSDADLNAYATKWGRDIGDITEDFIDTRLYIDYMF